MTSFNNFRQASFEEKCDWVTTSSNYLCYRKLGATKIYLYHTSDFFIEVYYSPAYKKILMINAFNNTEGLEPYLENISLSELNI
jgi:hypothetical protein